MSKSSISIEKESIDSRFLKLENIIGSLRYSLRVANDNIEYLMTEMKVLSSNTPPETYYPKHRLVNYGKPVAAKVSQHSTSTAENFVFNPIQEIDHDNYDRKAYVKMSELINRKTGASLNRALYARRRLEPFEKIIYYIGMYNYILI